MSSLARVTIVLIGPPGDGKSTLGNLLARGVCQGDGLPFKPEDSFTSGGAEIAHEDFEYEGVNHRIIDTTGLLEDLTKTADRLARISSLAPGGIDAYAFIIRKGRFTDEIFDRVVAFEGTAGKGALQRTVLVFSHSGRETNEQLIQRCRKSSNLQLHDAMQRTAALAAVELSNPARHAEDRAVVLAATAGICRAHRDTKLMPKDPSELRRELAEMDFAVAGLSGERRELMEAKVGSLRSGCASFDAVRRALNEARERQVLEDRSREEHHALSSSVQRAQQEAHAYRDAAISLSEPKNAQQAPHIFSCCTPTAACGETCGDPCGPCDKSATIFMENWYQNRQAEIISRFPQADAAADNLSH